LSFDPSPSTVSGDEFPNWLYTNGTYW
jgi:hypothetical protein